MENLKLLTDLYCVFSPSGGEKRMRRFIKKIAYDYGAEVVENDGMGNLYVTKGKSETYPCVVAHMDQVQHEHSKDFCVIRCGNVLFGYSEKCKSQQGLGADDKNGIFVALECLRKHDNIKLAFFVGEEIGCVGSSNANMDFFSNCRFVLQCDRKHRSDLITQIGWHNRLCSDEFLDAIHYADFGYVPTSGLMTDIEALTGRGIGLSCVNISCGYYNPHTDEESTSIDDLDNCLAFVSYIIENCTDVYPNKTDDDYSGFSGSDPYYDYCDSDYDTMYNILSQDNMLLFDDIKTKYLDKFITKNECALQDMYEDTLWALYEEEKETKKA